MLLKSKIGFMILGGGLHHPVPKSKNGLLIFMVLKSKIEFLIKTQWKYIIRFFIFILCGGLYHLNMFHFSFYINENQNSDFGFLHILWSTLNQNNIIRTIFTNITLQTPIPKPKIGLLIFMVLKSIFRFWILTQWKSGLRLRWDVYG